MGAFLLVAGACLLALLLVGLLLWGIMVAARRLSLNAMPFLLRGMVWAGAVLLVTGGLAGAGVLRDFGSLPPPLALVLFSVTLVTMVAAFTSLGDLLVRGVPLWALVGFQAFRLPVELLLLGLFLDGQIPERMTFEGANFDVITALGAIGVAALLQQQKIGPSLVWGWNVLGSLLLLNIVTISALSSPLPFEVFAEGPKNRMIADFPFVWIPTVFVQAALFGHLLVFRALRAKPTENQAPPVYVASR
jgi:hypothetical protein